ncbi:hypothetical protein GFB49_02685 [Epibacterium sp. SM1979]|uniref:Uncharacterized protein n=1 Tax=Tritonibacter litoralis TaxID=2662264 RepID=A0A843Y8K6_9RHOB|nr:hypothetical protein [Tritonibacter litoralis]MQQ07351.1 hypothetical protein [Tritonibacter litoralis]
MQLTSILVSLAVVANLTPALADVTGPGGKTIDCYCTDTSGARVELGQTICLFVDGNMFMAQCQMSLNVPMWRKIDDGCTISHLKQSRPEGQHPLKL